MKPLDVVHEGHVASDVFTSSREVIRSKGALALKFGELLVDAPFDLLRGKGSQVSFRSKWLPPCPPAEWRGQDHDRQALSRCREHLHRHDERARASRRNIGQPARALGR